MHSRSNADLKSKSAIAPPFFFELLKKIVSLAKAIAWCIRFSLPRANWEGEIMWLIIDENLLLSPDLLKF